MKITLATLNSKYIHMSLSIWYLKKGLDCYGLKGIETRLYEATINQSLDILEDELSALNSDIYCFSLYIWNIDKTLALCQSLKNRNPLVKIILGGPEATYQSNTLIYDAAVDYILMGEGEESLSDLVNRLFTKQPLDGVSGLVHLENDQLYTYPIKPLTCYLDPYTDEFLKAIAGRIVYLETTRGCPYHCAFCLSGIEDPLRTFDLAQAKENIVKLSCSTAKTIKFVDRTFNAHVSRSNEILSWIIDNPSGRVNQSVCFHFEIAGDILSEEFFNIIARAKKGLVQFEIGLQSFNEATLEACQRKTNMQVLIRNIERLISLNTAHVHIDLIAGLPLEDYHSFQNSFNQAYALKPHMLQLGFLKLIHGSYLKENNHKYQMNHSKKAPYTIISNQWLSVEELEKLQLVEHSLDKVYNSGRFNLTLIYLLETYKLNPFDLFYKIGCLIDSNIKHLDDYTNALYKLFEDRHDSMLLRDTMVIDCLASHASGRLPNELKVPFELLKRYRLALNKVNRETKGIKRAVEYLVNSHQIVYVDYINKDPISHRYEVHFIKCESLDISKV